MGRILKSSTAAANSLTARWCAAAGTENFVLSGASLWPLLALLAPTANEPARTELLGAVGLPVERSHAGAIELIDELAASASVSAALGVWFHNDIRPYREWLGTLPAGVTGRLTDAATLDRWVSRRTEGRIPRLPIVVDENTVAVLATALLARTTWPEPFDEASAIVDSGPWRGHIGTWLARTGTETETVAVLAGAVPVTRAIVIGDNDLDVHLLLGDAPPGTVLGAGLDALDDPDTAHTDLPAGTDAPGLVVRHIASLSPIDTVRLTLPTFEIRSEHPLLRRPALFGLTTCADTSRGHFPGIADIPLAITKAAQDVRASFTATGFEAAAVTALGVAVSSGYHRPQHRTRQLSVTFDRPFGFLAVHRPSGIAVVAGWVAKPPLDRSALVKRLRRSFEEVIRRPR